MIHFKARRDGADQEFIDKTMGRNLLLWPNLELSVPLVIPSAQPFPTRPEVGTIRWDAPALIDL